MRCRLDREVADIPAIIHPTLLYTRNSGVERFGLSAGGRGAGLILCVWEAHSEASSSTHAVVYLKPAVFYLKPAVFYLRNRT